MRQKGIVYAKQYSSTCISLCVCLSVCLSICVFVPLCLSICHSLSRAVSLTHSLSLALLSCSSLTHLPLLSRAVCLSVCLSICVLVPLCLSVCHPLSRVLSLSRTRSLSLFSHAPTTSLSRPSLSASVCLRLSVYLSVCPSVHARALNSPASPSLITYEACHKQRLVAN